MLKLNHIRLLKKIGMIFLATLLCFLLIFNAGIIDCFAFAVVDDALFWLLAAILAACGITFVSVEAAQDGTSSFYDNMDGSTQSIIDNIASKIETEFTMNSAIGYIGVTMLADYWKGVLDAVALTFGTYVGLSAVFNLTDDISLPLVAGDSYTIPFTVSETSIVSNIVGNMRIDGIGKNADLSNYPEFIQSFHAANPSAYLFVLSISDTLYSLKYVSSINSSISYNYGFCVTSYNTFVFNGTALRDIMYLRNGDMFTVVNATSSSFELFLDGLNAVQGGYIAGTSLSVSDSICPDGVWSNKSFSDWLNDLIGGVTLPGNPSIDAPSMPGNDVWHDGSINDDVAVGSPSIGIAVPTSDEDVISLNPDIARDYTNTDTKIGDIAGSDTATGDTTGDTSGDSTNNPPKNGNTGSLPALSLPEILFKEKFPFCLPWDIYTLFSVLDAEPVAPKFEIPFKFERLGIDESINIDFSDYDEQIKIIRFFLSASFVLGLILISRKIIGAN